MADIVRLPHKIRPLTATYNPNAPYTVEREDQDDGSIAYNIMDTRPDSYRFVRGISDFGDNSAMAKHDAEQIVRGLNLLVQYGKEQLPLVKDDDE